MTRRRPLILALACVALIALALGLAACGGDDDDSGAAAPETTAAGTTTAPATPIPTESTPSDTTGGGTAGATALALQADPTGQLKYVETELTAKAGDITITLTNASAVPHDVAVDGAPGVSDEVQDGGTATLKVNLPAGTYQYYCTVPGHRQAGMVGTLTVS
ncbi:MAG TPA: plastocyanin/azurin family copper-binding protein [Miltoncostaeaceae bacterium]|nr:plastocyanin/azurin family copper-binding protein [Miltoncostaeaceae bacterium]